jgi:hypothetical protein
VEFARALLSFPGTREAALAVYADELFSRSHPIAQTSASYPTLAPDVRSQREVTGKAVPGA